MAQRSDSVVGFYRRVESAHQRLEDAGWVWYGFDARGRHVYRLGRERVVVWEREDGRAIIYEANDEAAYEG